MRIECLYREKAAPSIDILAAFLSSFAASVKYGRTVIYDGERYFLPYYRLGYRIVETGEEYIFLNSRLSEEISVFKENGSTSVEIRREDAEDRFILEGGKPEETARQEIEKKIKLNKKMRKMFRKYHFEEQELTTVYIPEDTFYVKGKGEHLFLVDGFLGKVDYRHLGDVKRRFAENYIKSKQEAV